MRTWADPNLSDLEHFWTAPIAERAAAFASLREHEPVPFFPEPTFGMLPPGPGYWALTRFDDVVEASRTPKVFTSGAGATNITDLPPEFLEFFGSMINMDDPRHARLRRIVSRGFTPKRLAAAHRGGAAHGAEDRRRRPRRRASATSSRPSPPGSR